MQCTAWFIRVGVHNNLWLWWLLYAVNDRSATLSFCICLLSYSMVGHYCVGALIEILTLCLSWNANVQFKTDFVLCSVNLSFILRSLSFRSVITTLFYVVKYLRDHFNYYHIVTLLNQTYLRQKLLRSVMIRFFRTIFNCTCTVLQLVVMKFIESLCHLLQTVLMSFKSMGVVMLISDTFIKFLKHTR